MRERFNFKRLLSPYGVLFLFIVYAGVSIFWAIDKNTALIHWRFLVEAGAVFVLISSFVETRYIASHKIYWAIILSAIVQVGFAVAQSHMQYIPASTELGMAAQNASNLGASVVETVTGRWLRAYGTFPHPNILGAWLVLGLMSIIGLWRGSKFRVSSFEFRDIFLYSSFVIILFGLLLTFSRSAWLVFGVFLVIVILSEMTRRTRRGTESKDLIGNPWDSSTPRVRFAQNDGFKLFALTILTVAVFATVFPDPFLSRFSSNRLEVKSQTERMASWQEGIEIIKKHPILGAGVGNYGLAVHRDITSNQPAWYYQPAHNVFLLIWSELGIIGIILLILIVFMSLRAQRSGAKQSYNHDEDDLSNGPLQRVDRIASVVNTLPRNDILFLLPLLILSLFDHYLWSLYPGVMLAAVWLSLSSRPTQ